MFSDQQIIDTIDRTQVFDAHAIAEALCDDAMADGDLDQSELEIAFTTVERRADEIIEEWHQYKDKAREG